MDIGGLVTSLLSGSAITYFLGWLAGRKRYKADLESIKLKNIEATISIYQKIHNDLKEELDNLSNRCIKLTTEVELLRKENIDIRKSNAALEKSNSDLKKEIHNLNILLKNNNEKATLQ